MRPSSFSRLPAGALAAALLIGSAVPARCLVKFNDGHDELFITGTSGLVYDSNLFASADSEGDTSFNTSLDIDYRRRAGAIGVDGNLGLAAAAFDDNTEENYIDPHARAEFTKTGGRTTGSLSIMAARSSRADSLLNLRTSSWNYGSHFTCKYPVIQRYSIGADIGYDAHNYAADSALFDIRNYSAGADLFYRYTSERDLLAGYRLRITDTTAETRSYDHAFTLGSSGKLLPKLEGTVRVGYQFRDTDRAARGTEDTYSAYTASVATTWTATRRLNVVALASKDFSTLATDANTDTTAVSVVARFTANNKIAFNAGAEGGRVRFLASGEAQRRDTFVGLNASASYAANKHLTLSLSGSRFTNESTLAVADTTRDTISLIVSSRW